MTLTSRTSMSSLIHCTTYVDYTWSKAENCGNSKFATEEAHIGNSSRGEGYKVSRNFPISHSRFPSFYFISFLFQPSSNSNSLQCCCAGIFNIELDMVPNFINHPIDGYMMVFNCWIASKGLNMCKVDLTEELEFQQGQIVSNIGASFITGGSICILQSKNEFMIGQVDESSKRVKVIMDPNPSATSRNKPPYCAFFIYRSTTNYNKYYFSDQVGGYMGDDDLHQYSLQNCWILRCRNYRGDFWIAWDVCPVYILSLSGKQQECTGRCRFRSLLAF